MLKHRYKFKLRPSSKLVFIQVDRSKKRKQPIYVLVYCTELRFAANGVNTQGS